jgi:hypothetical protein
MRAAHNSDQAELGVFVSRAVNARHDGGAFFAGEDVGHGDFEFWRGGLAMSAGAMSLFRVTARDGIVGEMDPGN